MELPEKSSPHTGPFLHKHSPWFMLAYFIHLMGEREGVGCVPVHSGQVRSRRGTGAGLQYMWQKTERKKQASKHHGMMIIIE